ncbi:MAG: hypothetical protein ACOYMV_00195 [Verrucomicrobiia bacterium]
MTAPRLRETLGRDMEAVVTACRREKLVVGVSNNSVAAAACCCLSSWRMDGWVIQPFSQFKIQS